MFVAVHLAKWQMEKRPGRVGELKSACVSLFVLTAQSHLLRKVVDPTTGRLYLGLFLYLADNTQVIENSNYTVQLRYIRTTHTRIIRSYFAYTCMYIRVYAYVYTRIRVCQYARICPFVMHSHKFLCMKHCWSNKGHMGMKRLQSAICILLKRHADQ